MTGYKRYHSHSGTCQRLHDVTPEQFEQLLDLIPEPYASMVFVAVWTDGITQGESRDGDLWGQQPTERPVFLLHLPNTTTHASEHCRRAFGLWNGARSEGHS